jgi:hypothetical protein
MCDREPKPAQGFPQAETYARQVPPVQKCENIHKGPPVRKKHTQRVELEDVQALAVPSDHLVHKTSRSLDIVGPEIQSQEVVVGDVVWPHARKAHEAEHGQRPGHVVVRREALEKRVERSLVGLRWWG